jgi:Uma2 family endonuclease
MVHAPWRHPPLTPEQEDDLFMVLLEDDTEDAPWMTMGDLQFWSASSFAHSLRIYGHQQGLGWYVASMLPILYRWQNEGRKKQLSPDTFVAFVPEHPRTSYDLEIEGTFPPFVLEVVSPSSTERDQVEKTKAYDLLGAQEYALFTPRLGTASLLEGYRRDAKGRFVTWPLDDEGRLHSAVLGLHLVVRGEMLQAQTPDRRLLLTWEETVDALQRAEAEAERLRRELEHYRREARDR